MMENGYDFLMEKRQADSTTVQFIAVDKEFCDQRIDNFLISRLKGVPKSRIYRMLRTGEVRINKGRAQAKTRLKAGDIIRVPPVRMSQPSTDVASTEFLKQRLENCVLYEDDMLLVIDKPSGMPVHGGSGVSFGVIEGMRQLRPKARFLELAHRLDRDTSGCLIIAKKRAALLELHELFRCDLIAKRYFALLAGAWNRKRSTVNAALLKNVKKGGERIVTAGEGGKPAETDFKRLKLFSNATLVEAKPKTGRTHQIRVHAAYMGHSILGDARYGDENLNRDFRKRGLNRLFLHAEQLVFAHPATGEPLRVSAPLDKTLLDFLESLTERAI